MVRIHSYPNLPQSRVLATWQAIGRNTPYTMTSDHRVAGSSPAGCKSAAIADSQTIYSLKIEAAKTITCQSLATFNAIPLNFSRLMTIYTDTSHVHREQIHVATLYRVPIEPFVTAGGLKLARGTRVSIWEFAVNSARKRPISDSRTLSKANDKKNP